MEINLSNHIKENSKVLSGRLEGKNVRTKMQLDTEDEASEVVNITFPDDVISLNSSFFLGLFGPSVRRLGREKFKEKYNFVAPLFIKKSIEDGIERALKTSNSLKTTND